MKKITSLLTIILMVAMLLTSAGGTAFADEDYYEDYYRASSSTGKLTDEQKTTLDNDCLDFIKEFKIDMVLLAFDSSERNISDMKASSDKYYEECNFGYGKTRDGIMATYDVYENILRYTFYGKAVDLIPESYVEFAEGASVEQADEYGEWGVLYMALGYMREYLREHGTAPQASSGIGSEDNSERGAAGMPSWYPKDIESFEFYHDSDAPRVVDTADIFTDSEEKELAGLIEKASSESGKDIVVFTDISTYGLSHRVYAADFYDFNGYGFGDDREGVCLMICMDPNDRGWWTCCTGPDTMGLYTESIANSIDDVLYNYMVGGEYAAGVSDWIQNMNTLFIKGIPFAPPWYPDRGEEIVRTHDSDAPRASDISGELTLEQLDELEMRCREMSERFGYDIVIHVTDTTYSIGKYDYMEKFYTYNGYGFGEDYDGIIAVLFTNSDTSIVSAYGKAGEKVSEVNHSRLESQSEKNNKYAAAVRFLDNLEHMEKTGRVPRSMFTWVFGAVIFLIIGAVFALIDYLRAKAGMKTPQIAFDANNYIVKGSLYVKAVLDRYLRTTTTRTYDPIKDDDDSSSGGGSSYSSSYSGSSGSSHSGSGRSF